MDQTRKKSGAQAGGALAAVKAALSAIPADEVTLPVIPVDRMVGEGMALAAAAKEHADELTAAGLDEALLEDLRVRAQALSDAQAQLLAIRGLKKSAAEVALELAGLELRSDMIADARFALRADADAQSILDRIQEGEGLDDLVQDLRALAIFVQQHTDALNKIGAQPEVKGQQAQKIASELADVLAMRRAGDSQEANAIDLRNRAAVHLQDAISEIRATGVYVFRKQPRIVTKFRSAYFGAKRAHRKSGPTPPAPAPTSA